MSQGRVGEGRHANGLLRHDAPSAPTLRSSSLAPWLTSGHFQRVLGRCVKAHEATAKRPATSMAPCDRRVHGGIVPNGGGNRRARTRLCSKCQLTRNFHGFRAGKTPIKCVLSRNYSGLRSISLENEQEILRGNRDFLPPNRDRLAREQGFVGAQPVINSGTHADTAPQSDVPCHESRLGLCCRRRPPGDELCHCVSCRRRCKLPPSPSKP